MRKFLIVMYAIVLLPLLGIGISMAQDSAQDVIVENRPNESVFRLKYSIAIHSVDEFIQFLKTHQFEGDGVARTPTKDEFFPSHAMWWGILPEDLNEFKKLDKFKIDLDRFKSKVKVSTDDNITHYTLELQPDDFPDMARDTLYANAFGFAVMMSDKGDVVIRHHMGI